MPLRLVVPITAPTMDGAVEQVSKLRNEFDSLKEYYNKFIEGNPRLNPENLELFYEWRVDCIQPVYQINVVRFANAAKGLKGIFTPRHISEAGPNNEKFGFKGDERKRRDLFLQAIAEGFSYMDLEIKQAEGFRDLEDFRDSKDTLLVSSYHNFEIMPSIRNLRNLHSIMKGYSSDCICKFALSVNSKYDLMLLKSGLPINHNIQTDLVAIGMGELGRETRLNPCNYFAYTPLTLNGASANGQFTAKETIDKILLGI